MWRWSLNVFLAILCYFYLQGKIFGKDRKFGFEDETGGRAVCSEARSLF